MRLCPEHAQQLNHRKNQETLRAQQELQKKHRRQSQDEDGSDRDAKRKKEEDAEGDVQKHKPSHTADVSGQSSAARVPAEGA